MFLKGRIEIYRERGKKKREEKLTNFVFSSLRFRTSNEIFIETLKKRKNRKHKQQFQHSIFDTSLLHRFFFFFFLFRGRKERRKRKDIAYFCLDSRRIHGKISGWKSKKWRGRDRYRRPGITRTTGITFV